MGLLECQKQYVKKGEKDRSELISHQTAHLSHVDHAVPDRGDKL